TEDYGLLSYYGSRSPQTAVLIRWSVDPRESLELF
ncbi:hypothetical protein TNCV_4409731, partial [Trichonephila clavipes]